MQIFDELIHTYQPQFEAAQQLIDSFDKTPKPDLNRLTAGHFHVPFLKIEKVIFNNPATIILWDDGTKTVVRCQPCDEYDQEKGFVMCYLKKLLGNDNTFNKEISKWVTVDEPKDVINETKPLTNEQLMKMDGKKVWLSSMSCGFELFDDSYCGWHTVKVAKNRVEDSDNSGYNFYSNGADYGFRAYLKPPKNVK